MLNHDFNFLTNIEIRYFERVFQETVGTQNDEIFFDEFRDILLNYKKFNRTIVLNSIDKIKKKLKEGMGSNTQDSELILSNRFYINFYFR